MGMRQYQIPRNNRALCNNKDFWKFGNPTCEPAKEHWEWTSEDNDCPDDFLNAANAYGAPKPECHIVEGSLSPKWGVGQFYGDGNWRYDSQLTNADADAVSITITFNAYLPGDATPQYTFEATATRPSATDDSPVPVNGNPRPAGK